MPFPLQITFRGVDQSDALESWIRDWADKLERVSDRIERGEVVVEAPHKHHRQGAQFHVRIHLRVPGTDIDVDRDPGPDEAHQDPYVAVRDSFHAARRRLEDHVRKLRGDVKARTEPEHAKVVYLDAERAWGWLETGDGRRVYFHRDSVLGGVDQLGLGTEVRFREEAGEEGPQASTVEPLGEHAHHELPPS
jgi:ribosome-associated translation inhibitor RaiA